VLLLQQSLRHCKQGLTASTQEENTMNHKVHRFKTPDYRDSRLQTTRIQTQKLLKSNSWHEEGITRVIVTICILNVRIAMCRILPCLRQQTVVPVYVVRIIAQLPVLGVLLDGCIRLLLGCHLHLCFRPLWYLHYEIEQGPVAVLP
jgi:hypothetical protein